LTLQEAALTIVEWAPLVTRAGIAYDKYPEAAP
jgi:hypothetical protein